MTNELLIFTLENCGRCVKLKERLKNESIPFREIEVGKNKAIWNQVVEQTKNEYLPSFYIKQEGTNKGPFFCPERDFNTDDEAVNIIKGYMTKEEGG